MRIVRATSVKVLADELARQLAEHPPADPMAPVQIAVPSRGMERWLSLRLSHHLGATGTEAGITANIRFAFPLSIIQQAIAAVLGHDPDAADPWMPDRLVWPLLDHLDELPEDPEHAPLLAHLADGDDRATRRRFPLARRIADLFDRYAMYRPEMVGGWSRGGNLDADGSQIAASLAWQPILWRAMRERIPTPSPDDRFRQAVDALASGEIARPDDLPSDVTIFGVEGLPPLQLQLLDALSRHVPVTIHAVAPVPAWDPRAQVAEATHPLLASCGMAARDAHNALAHHQPPDDTTGGDDGQAADADQGANPGEAASDSAHPTALAVLQGDIRADRRRGHEGDQAPHPLAPDDRSIQVHACHGPMRQLEVLREVLLGLLEDDPTLEPRDIVVLTPEITAYDALIRAVFSDGDPPGDRPSHDRTARDREAGTATGDPDDAASSGVPTLPYRVADRAVTDDNGAAQALLSVLELATARVGASAVLDLLARAPVRDRFDLSATDLADLPAWIRGTGISWGMDADHRQQLIDLDDPAHTWQAGLDRLALGAAMPDDGTRMVAGVVPYDDVEGGAVDLLGRLTAATEALFTSLRDLRDPRPIDAWRDALDTVVDRLLDPGPRRDGELTAQLAAVRQALVDMVDDSVRPDGTPSPVDLTLEEVRSVITSRLGRGGGRTTYGSGAITFAGLVPLRNVPFRVVCLVGMDDGAIPRSGVRHGFDLIAADPRPGDPDPRVEDRQLLLDAILSAGDHLVVTYTGSDPRTNEDQQPAVPISELLDVLDDSLVVEAAGGSSDAVRDRLVTHHPLQPHSARYFRDPADGEAPVPLAFDRRHLQAALTAARVAAGERAAASAFLPGPLPDPTEEEVDPDILDLDELVRFLEHPVRHLLQRRVGIVLGDDDPRLEDRDPTDLDGLGRWKLGQALLDQRLAGTAPGRWRDLVLATGTVPVGGLGQVELEGLEQLTGALADRVNQVPGTHRSIPIEVTVPVPGQEGSRRLVGSVDLVGSTILRVTVSKDSKRRWLAVWVRLLAATAMGEYRPEGLLLTRHDKERTAIAETTLHPVADVLADLAPGGVETGAAEVDAGPVDGETGAAEMARRLLGDLVGLYVRGMVEPVPVLPETGAAYAATLLGSNDDAAAFAKARTTWELDYQRRGDRFDAYVGQAFGAEPGLEAVDADGVFRRDATTLWRPIIIAQRGPTKVSA